MYTEIKCKKKWGNGSFSTYAANIDVKGKIKTVIPLFHHRNKCKPTPSPRAIDLKLMQLLGHPQLLHYRYSFCDAKVFGVSNIPLFDIHNKRVDWTMFTEDAPERYVFLGDAMSYRMWELKPAIPAIIQPYTSIEEVPNPTTDGLDWWSLTLRKGDDLTRLHANIYTTYCGIFAIKCKYKLNPVLAVLYMKVHGYNKGTSAVMHLKENKMDGVRAICGRSYDDAILLYDTILEVTSNELCAKNQDLIQMINLFSGFFTTQQIVAALRKMSEPDIMLLVEICKGKEPSNQIRYLLEPYFKEFATHLLY